MQHIQLKIYGRVQGVFFRRNAQKEANRLEIRGFVRNEPDGSVYIEAEGQTANLEKFIEWCKYGPPLAQVEGADISQTKQLKHYREFKIDYN